MLHRSLHNEVFSHILRRGTQRSSCGNVVGRDNELADDQSGNNRNITEDSGSTDE